MRILCCAIVILCSLLAGVETARKHKLNCDVLNDICKLCLHMQSCIKYERTEPEMIMQSFAANTAPLSECITSIKQGYSFHDAWTDMTENGYIKILCSNERLLVAEMGEKLGMCDTEGELARLSRLSLQLESCLQKRHTELESKRRLCITYGLLAGIFISIIII